MGAHTVKQPTKTLLYIAGLFLVMGVIDPHLLGNTSDPSPLVLVYALVFAVLIFQWCKADAKLRGVEPPPGLSVLAAFLAPIGVPVYFFFTMPFVQAIFATANRVKMRERYGSTIPLDEPVISPAAMFRSPFLVTVAEQ